MASEQMLNLSEVDVISASQGETRRLGGCLGKLARPGMLLFLIGPFGAGKTTFTQGFARSLGVEGPVTSPSFTLVNEYHMRGASLYHIDLFRIDRPEDALALGLEEYVTGNSICVVEWPEQADAIFPYDRLEIRFSFLGDKGRRLALVARGTQHAQLVRRFAERCVPATLGARV